MNRRTLYYLVPIVIIAAGVLVMTTLLSTREDTPRRAAEPRTRLVSTMVVEPRAIAADMTAFGRVRSSDPVQLIAEVSGTLLHGDVAFKPAQTFRRGDLLVRIDDRQTRLEINSTKSDLLTALAQLLPEIKLDFPDQYPRWQTYFDSCSFDRPLPKLPEVTDQKIKLFLARFNVYKLYFAVRDLEIKLEKHSFYAPFDGSIVTAGLRPGSIARQGSVLGEIISLEQLEVEVPLPAADLAWIDPDRMVRFTSREHIGEWTGRILRVGSDIDTRTQSVPVYMILDSQHNGALLNGVFLEATIPGRTIDNAVEIPNRALYQQRYVYVVQNGTLQQRDVLIARRQTESVIVNGGLQRGDTLVTEVLQGVAPGMPASARRLTGEG